MSVGEKKREPWPDKAQRLQKNSPLASTVAGWELASFIVKSNDDLRQEVFIMQMIRFFDSIWPKELTWLNCYFIEATGPDVRARSLSLTPHMHTHTSSLPLPLQQRTLNQIRGLGHFKPAPRPSAMQDYTSHALPNHAAGWLQPNARRDCAVATLSSAYLPCLSPSPLSLFPSLTLSLSLLYPTQTGLIQTIKASSDLDHLKKREGYTSLRQLFIERHGPPESNGFKAAQDNFAKSLAAYSVVMWILKLRDRHNGNLMLDEQGHFFHIDFGFCLGHSTGKGIGGMVECSNFKLTNEYIEVLDGKGSEVFERYCKGCVAAMKASHEHAATILSMVEIVGTRSGFPCFGVVPVKKVIKGLKKRLFMDKRSEEVEAEYRKVVMKAAGHWGSRKYDWFQQMQRGTKP